MSSVWETYPHAHVPLRLRFHKKSKKVEVMIPTIDARLGVVDSTYHVCDYTEDEHHNLRFSAAGYDVKLLLSGTEFHGHFYNSQTRQGGDILLRLGTDFEHHKKSCVLL